MDGGYGVDNLEGLANISVVIGIPSWEMGGSFTKTFRPPLLD